MTHQAFGLRFPRPRRPALNVKKLILLTVTLAAISGALVVQFSAIQKQRDLAIWENKLDLMASSRTAEIEGWMDRHFKELRAVASNPSLQLYLTDVIDHQSGDVLSEKPAPKESAQTVFLRNLLLITADRLGFLEKEPTSLSVIKANTYKNVSTGLALLDKNGHTLVSTSGFAKNDENLLKKIAPLPLREPALIDMYEGPEKELHLGFVLPVYAIQADPHISQPIGRLVAVKKLDESFFDLLRQPGAAEKTLRAFLLRREGNDVVYLSPADEHSPLSLRRPLKAANLDAARALLDTGSFGQSLDLLANPTLFTSRNIEHTPWVLMLHISRQEALADSDRFRRNFEIVLFFALIALLGSIVAAWAYGSSKKAYLSAMEAQRLAKRMASQERLLRVIADNQLEPILMVDDQNIVRFGNEKAARLFHVFAPDLAGKDLVALMGAARAKSYQEANENALRTNSPLLHNWQDGTAARTIQSVHIPLKQLPLEHLPEGTPGVLIIDQDVSAVVNERDRSLATQRQLINALVNMVDERDHNAANHSAAVAFLAREMATSMGLGDQLVNTTEVAGKLMNIGKIAVPSEILTKQSSLEASELQLIRDSLQKSADFLQQIAFDGPVVDTLRQMQEHYNGSGPLQLKGEKIIITARIIAVANAFIGMVSPRSYRMPLDMDFAVKELLKDEDTHFDHRVVVALADFVENKKGREEIKQIISQS